MVKGTIIRVFIATPSDVDHERKTIFQLIEEWNHTHSVDGVIAEAIHWRTHHRAMGGDKHPQKIIDRRLLDGYDCDVLVGLFGNRLGTPTDTHSSGTVEEIEHFSIRKGKENVMLFFGEWKIARNANQRELKRLDAFKESVKKWAAFQPIKSERRIRDTIRPHLEKVLNEICQRIPKQSHQKVMIEHGQRLERTWRHFKPEWDTLQDDDYRLQNISIFESIMGVMQAVLSERDHEDKDERWNQLDSLLDTMRDICQGATEGSELDTIDCMSSLLTQLKHVASAFQS